MSNIGIDLICFEHYPCMYILYNCLGNWTTDLNQGFAARQVLEMVVFPGNGRDAQFIAVALLIVLGVHLDECLARCELWSKVSRIDHARSAQPKTFGSTIQIQPSMKNLKEARLLQYAVVLLYFRSTCYHRMSFYPNIYCKFDCIREPPLLWLFIARELLTI